MLATGQTLLNFIGGFDKVFIIPPFQRNYEWTSEQCDELFGDIIDSHKSQKTHYLGNIVYYVGKNSGASYNELILVDGQQRVATILVLLCALRDSVEEKTVIDSINKRYLVNDTGDNRFRVRLKQTPYDSKSFMSIIDQRPKENDDNNITKNYNRFLKLIAECDVSAKDIYEAIPKLEVVDVNLQIDNDLEAIQTVFEKINSTGKQLTPADLIRNFLLLANTTAEQERLYEDYWVKIEQTIKDEHERKNVPVPLNQVTIEHIMPQKLNEWWITNLGGKEVAEEIHDKYLNCIGNMTPISQSYNSKILNNPWTDKRPNIKDVQFVVTSEIANNPEWKESEIKARNVDIAARACAAITAPIERTRKYQTKNSANEFISGVYPISDISTPMSGAVLECIIYDNKNIEVSTWKDFLCSVCSIVHKLDAEMFELIVMENEIHKATSKKNYPKKDPIITQIPNLLGDAMQIGETEYFSEGNISSDRARVYAKQLGDIFGVTNKIQISVRER